jgi:F0F1-type ATP synthase assembly protein I
MTKESEDKLKETKAGVNKLLKYSSLALEMGIMIFGGAIGGNWLDNKFNNKTPWFTIGLSLFAVIGSTYLVISKLINDK